MASKVKTSSSRFLSPNVQFALILVLAIIFSFVIVGLLWLQSVGEAKDPELYFLGGSSVELVVPTTLNIRATGVSDPDLNLAAAVVLFDKSLGEIVFNKVIRFTSDSKGVFKSKDIDFSEFDLSSKYDILVKGSKHQQIKFLDVELANRREIDLTSRSLPPGDLRWLSTGQDKIVNLDDYDALVSRLGSRDPVDLAVADLDINGVVNAQDRSLLLKTLMGDTQ